MTASGQTRYRWTGRDRYGAVTCGETLASDPDSLKRELYRQGILLANAKVATHPKPGSRDRKQTPIFLKQCASLLQAGLPLVQAMDICIESAGQVGFARVLQQIRGQLGEGSSLHEAIANSALGKDVLMLSLIRAAEDAGTLDVCLERLACQAEKTALLQARLRKALSYPAAVLIVTVLVTALMLTRVVPQFAQTFTAMGAELPWLTQALMSASDYVRRHLLPLALIPAAAVPLLHWSISRFETLRVMRDQLSLRLPVTGGLVKNACLARLCRTLSDSLHAGVPLLQALHSAAPATGNRVCEQACLQLAAQIQQGQTLGFAVRTHSWFPVMIGQLIHAGEQSGTLDRMLENCALRYEQAVEQTVDRLGSLIEPVIMGVLGIVIATLMLAMYLPVFRLGAVL